MADNIREDVNEVCIDINKMLGQALQLSKHQIFKVPHELRQVNEKAYDPFLISIGPYHRGKDNLMAMEEHKRRFLNSLLQRRNEIGLERYVAEMRDMVDDARKCYAENVPMSDKEFLKMMVLDGCFIVELLHRLHCNDTGDLIFNVDLVFKRILNDLILFENQLPFSVIWKLLSMTSQNEEHTYIKAFLMMFEQQMPGLSVNRVINPENVKHLLDLLHSNWRPRPEIKFTKVSFYDIKRLSSRKAQRREHYIEWSGGNINATTLREAGIKFRKGYRGENLFDIKFSNGVLRIPTVTVNNHTECLFRNIIACEQFDNRVPAYLTDYMIFMDRLIDSQKDVDILTRRGIIINKLGDDEDIVSMFNKHGDNVGFYLTDYFYQDLFWDFHEHCRSPWNRWISHWRNHFSDLMNTYFNSPWSQIKFLAATILLVLTFLQTLFTIFPRSGKVS